MNLDEKSDNQELLQAQAHIWNHVFNYINSMSLKCAIQLGIPDIIHKHGQPITLDKLIDALPINKAKGPHIYRLMRILIQSGFFIKVKITEIEDDEEEGYMLTSASKLLVKENPLSMAPFLLAMLDPILVDPWQYFSQWFQNNDTTTCNTCHGKAFFELLSHDLQFKHLFNEAMASDARLVSSVLSSDCKDVFEGLNSLVDVGGGTGTLAKDLADSFARLDCIVLDLPHVIDGLAGKSGKLTYVGGNMFEAIPPADAAVLKWILHDWSDEDCVRILKKCKEAIPNREKGGKVIIIDILLNDLPKGADNDETTEAQLLFDMLMMIVVLGKERNEKEWAKLFFDSGFTDYKITRLLGVRCFIEVYY